MLDLLELKVIIRKQGNAYNAVTEQSNGEYLWSNTFQYDPRQFMPPDSFDAPGQQRGAVSRVVHKITRGQRRSPQEKLVAKYGAHLYAYAFGNGKEFRDFLKAHKEPVVIRLILVFTSNTAVLSGLPWEYLYDGRNFLRQKNIQIFRQSDEAPEAVSAPVPGPLRVLVLISSPDDQAPLNMDDELGHIQDALAPAGTAGRIELVVLPEVTEFTLRRALRDTYY
ncbi:MAG: hypothetical protein E4H27_09760, partial [Anaerolineales bacterium]